VGVCVLEVLLVWLFGFDFGFGLWCVFHVFFLLPVLLGVLGFS
jgi:hypothetical protein